MKVKSKISYLGERNSILPGQMAEQLAVEVNVKNVTEYTVHSTQQQEQEQDKLHYFVWILICRSASDIVIQKKIRYTEFFQKAL